MVLSRLDRPWHCMDMYNPWIRIWVDAVSWLMIIVMYDAVSILIKHFTVGPEEAVLGVLPHGEGVWLISETDHVNGGLQMKVRCHGVAGEELQFAR